MECVSPPELNDEQLLRHLDDEADDQVEMHVARCSHCRERAADLTCSSCTIPSLANSTGSPAPPRWS
jgi:hypothetical protein